MKKILGAVRFLTILPVPGKWGTTEKALAGSVRWFPGGCIWMAYRTPRTDS